MFDVDVRTSMGYFAEKIAKGALMAGEKNGLSYAAAGVDIDAGNALVERETRSQSDKPAGCCGRAWWIWRLV